MYEKQKIYFIPDAYQIILSFLKENKTIYYMDKRIKAAEKRGLIGKEHSQELLKYLEKIKNNIEFQRDWKYIEIKWGKRFYPSHEERIYFSTELLKYINLNLGRIHSRRMDSTTVFRGIKEINKILLKHNIDGIVAGNPLVDLFEMKMEIETDRARRAIARIEIPFNVTVERLRKIVEREYVRLRKICQQYFCVPKARWGEKTGARERYKNRNDAIIKEYLRLKKQGFSDEKAFSIIYDKLNLKNEMTDEWSIKPIIKKTGKNR